MSIEPRTPCLIGAGRRTWRPVDGVEAPEPLAMWEEVARLAADDTDASVSSGALLAGLDAVRLVYCQSWTYDDPPARLAERLGASPGLLEDAGIGGTKPQELVADCARRMLAGELDLAFVGGGEALDTKRRLKKAGERPAWSHRATEQRDFPFEAPFIGTEIAHEVFQAWLTFALFDVGRRAALGVEPEAYRRSIGELFAPLSAVAAANPHAWFPVARSADELVTPTAENRMVGYPYTKYTVAVMDVDMAAGVLVATHAKADELGVPADRRVYVRGWSYLTDPVYVAEHTTFAASPAMPVAFGSALGAAGVGIDDVAHLDLYSCFPSSVAYACDALGIDPSADARPLTVTGGLPYHGGPGSNYLSHALGTMVDVLRADPGSVGLVSGVGMHMTKHAVGLYSTEPPPTPLAPPDDVVAQAGLDAAGARTIVDAAVGEATVATYSVVHGRDGAPAWALLVCDLPSGDRCYARALDPDLLAALEVEEWVGRSVMLADGGAAGMDGVNLATA